MKRASVPSIYGKGGSGNRETPAAVGASRFPEPPDAQSRITETISKVFEKTTVQQRMLNGGFFMRPS